tara:strand:- start:311 stop:475 length:165 start_codon:yes stop_codon:yes gene_type:complete
MGELKKLFLDMQQAMIEGRQIEKEIQDRMRDDEYRYSIYKKDNQTKTKDNGEDK